MKEKILFKLSKSDKEYLKKEADKRRLPLSTYVRHRILYKEEKEENQQSKSIPLC